MAVKKLNIKENDSSNGRKDLRRAYITAVNAFDKALGQYGYHREYDSKTGKYVVFRNDSPNEFYLANITMDIEYK